VPSSALGPYGRIHVLTAPAGRPRVLSSGSGSVTAMVINERGIRGSDHALGRTGAASNQAGGVARRLRPISWRAGRAPGSNGTVVKQTTRLTAKSIATIAQISSWLAEASKCVGGISGLCAVHIFAGCKPIGYSKRTTAHSTSPRRVSRHIARRYSSAPPVNSRYIPTPQAAILDRWAGVTVTCATIP
jgi:hypothetical protein